MQVVVLAGGVGSRLRPWTNSVPKPLLPVLDQTLLEHVVRSLPVDMVDEVVVAGGYKVDQIKAYFDSADAPFDLRIVPEDEPLGTGGALGNCRDVVSGTFACFNGDIISSLDASSLLNMHRTNGSVGTLGLWEVEDPSRFGIVGLDESNKITKFKEKPAPEEVFSNLINAGSYIFNDDVFDWMPRGKANGWKTAAKKPVANQDLWQKLDESVIRHQVRWHWVKGHAGNPLNERCDLLARSAAEAIA